MIQKITQNNWNFWTLNLIMRATKIVNQSSDFPVRRTGSYRHKKSTEWEKKAKQYFLVCIFFNAWQKLVNFFHMNSESTISSISFWHALRMVHNNEIETINTSR